MDIKKIPPRDLDAEQSVVGAMLMDSAVVGEGLTLLAPTDFYDLKNRVVFEAIKRLYHKNMPVDVTTVCNELRLMKQYNTSGGVAYVANLLERVATTSHLQAHAKILRKKRVLRDVIHACAHISEEAYRDEQGVADLLTRAEEAIFQISEKDRGGQKEGLTPLSFSSLDLYESNADLLEGIPSGFDAFDRFTSGLHRGDLIIVAGRPSMGKTALALNIAERMALIEKRAVGFFSLEMSREQLADRLLCGLAGVNASASKRLIVPQGTFDRLARAASSLEDARLFIDDTPALSDADLRARARRMRSRHGVEAIFVDYMQLMEGSGESRQQEITKISRSLKAMAKELSVPVIALSQLNRAVETRGGDKRPQLADLRESGAIEQDADVVCFVYRESHAFQRDTNNRGEDISDAAEIIIAKQRSGPTGTAKLRFRRELTRFENE